jgi:hypothetical protein
VKNKRECKVNGTDKETRPNAASANSIMSKMVVSPKRYDDTSVDRTRELLEAIAMWDIQFEVCNYLWNELLNG